MCPTRKTDFIHIYIHICIYIFTYRHVRWTLMHSTGNLYAIGRPLYTRNMTLFICSIGLHLQVTWIFQSFEEFHTVDKVHLDWINFLSPSPSFSFSFTFSFSLAFPIKQSFQTKYFLDLWALHCSNLGLSA